MSDPLSNVERMIDQWERDAEEKAARYDAMSREVERISITESAANGAVSVTVGHNGIPTDVQMTDGVSRLRPNEIAAAVLEAMRKAQSRYPAKLAEIMGETVGENETTRHILSVAEQNFPAAEPEDEPEADRQPRFGYEEGGEDDTPPPAARPPRSPRRSDGRPDDGDDEDFSDRNFIS